MLIALYSFLLLALLVMLAYCYFVIGSLKNFSNLSTQALPKNNTQFYHFTIVVPFKNEGHNLPKLFQSIAQLNYPPEFLTLILIDDHSNDGFQIPKDLLHIKTQVILNDGNGKKRAITTALKHCTSEYVILTDADCEPVVDWVWSINTYLQNSGSDLLIMPVVSKENNNFVEQFQALEFLSLIASTFGSYQNPIMCNGANLCFRVSSFLRWAPYEQNWTVVTGDDVFLLHAAKRDKSAIISFSLQESMWVYTSVKNTWAAFFEQRVRWGSKTIDYSDKRTLYVASLVLLVSLIAFGSLLVSIFVPSLFQFFLLFVLCKICVDYFLLAKAAQFFKKSNLLKWYFPIAIVYIFYVPIAAFAGIIRNLTSYKINERAKK